LLNLFDLPYKKMLNCVESCYLLETENTQQTEEDKIINEKMFKMISR